MQGTISFEGLRIAADAVFLQWVQVGELYGTHGTGTVRVEYGYDMGTIRVGYGYGTCIPSLYRIAVPNLA